MTPLAFQFEKRSLLERLPADARSQGFKLTPHSQEIAAAARQIVAAKEAVFLSAFTSTEEAALRAALASLKSARTSPQRHRDRRPTLVGNQNYLQSVV